MPPHECNPRGFWESEHLSAAVHEDLLTSVNSHWHDYQRLDPRPDGERGRGRHRERIKETISQEFGEAPLFVLKDPRICRFLPLTLSILEELNARSVGILQIRNPWRWHLHCANGTASRCTSRFCCGSVTFSTRSIIRGRSSDSSCTTTVSCSTGELASGA